VDSQNAWIGFKAIKEGLTILWVGFIFAMLGTGVAALVERKRRTADDPKDLSVLLSLPQFFCVGLMEVLSFVGLMEFFSNQLPVKLKSLSSSMVFCIVGIAIWIDGALVGIVGRVTRSADKENGWLDGMGFESTRLDLFYAFLTALEFLSFLIFVFCAKRYLLRQRSNQWGISPNFNLDILMWHSLE